MRSFFTEVTDIILHPLSLSVRWFDLVVVLQTDNTVLYERLEQRGYPAAKISENVECEIMMVLLQEAHDSYE